MRILYTSILFLYSIFTFFRFKISNKVVFIDFDFTLVDYDLNRIAFLDVNHCYIKDEIVQLMENYKNEGYIPFLFTARGLRSKKVVSRFLFANNLHFRSNLFLGNTKNKFFFLNFILFFTDSKVVLIDDLSDFDFITKKIHTYNISEYIRPNLNFKYINPLTYENF